MLHSRYASLSMMHSGAARPAAFDLAERGLKGQGFSLSEVLTMQTPHIPTHTSWGNHDNASARRVGGGRGGGGQGEQQFAPPH